MYLYWKKILINKLKIKRAKKASYSKEKLFSLLKIVASRK